MKFVNWVKECITKPSYTISRNGSLAGFFKKKKTVCGRVIHSHPISFFSRFGLSWVMPDRVVDLFACWWMGGSSQSVVVWKMMPSCLLWCLWRERNDRNFEDREKALEELSW